MAARIQKAVSRCLDNIYRCTRDRWGGTQADRRITGMFAAFDRIGTHGILSKPIPAAFGLMGHFFRYKKHFVYWIRLRNYCQIMFLRPPKARQLPPVRAPGSGMAGRDQPLPVQSASKAPDTAAAGKGPCAAAEASSMISPRKPCASE